MALAVEQTAGCEYPNIDGAIDLESGQMQMLLIERVDAVSPIAPLGTIEWQFSANRRI